PRLHDLFLEMPMFLPFRPLFHFGVDAALRPTDSAAHYPYHEVRYLPVHDCSCQSATSLFPCSMSVARSPLFQTTWSARLIFSSREFCDLIICPAWELFRVFRFPSRSNSTFGEQATTPTRSKYFSPPVS